MKTKRVKGFSKAVKERAKSLWPDGAITRRRLAMARFSIETQNEPPGTKLSFREIAEALFSSFRDVSSGRERNVLVTQAGRYILPLVDTLGSPESNGFGMCIAPINEYGLRNPVLPQTPEAASPEVRGKSGSHYLPYVGIVINSLPHYQAYTEYNKKVGKGLIKTNDNRQQDMKLLPVYKSLQLRAKNAA